MKNQVYVIGLITSLATIYTACQDDSGSARRKKFFGANASGELTTVDVEAASTEEDGELALAGDAVNKMKLKVRCDNVPEEVVEDSQFDLPVGATNCKAKLVSIKIGDKNYIEPVGGSGFTHYLAKDTGKLVNEADAKDILFVKVKQQLPTPLKVNSGVQYVYSNVTQFDTVEVEHAELPTQGSNSGIASPKLKVSKAFIGTYGGLNIVLKCDDAADFVGDGVTSLTCGGVEIKKDSILDFALVPFTTKLAKPSDTELKSLIPEKEYLNYNDRKGIYSPTNKTITFNFGIKKKEKQVFVARAKNNAGQQSFAYGFVKFDGIPTLAVAACPAQGDQANFILESVQGGTNMGTWKDTSNCWLWMRPDTKKVKSLERFKQCPAIKAGETVEHRTLPYYTEFKAARDRKLVELAKGPAPKLGDDLDKTFWLAGGRVFNAADGSVREVKDVKPNETHNVLCVLKRD